MTNPNLNQKFKLILPVNIIIGFFVLLGLVYAMFYSYSSSAFPFTDVFLYGFPVIIILAFNLFLIREDEVGKRTAVAIIPLMWPFLLIINFFEELNYAIQQVNIYIELGESPRDFYWQQVLRELSNIYYEGLSDLPYIVAWFAGIILALVFSVVVFKIHNFYKFFEKILTALVFIAPILFFFIFLRVVVPKFFN